MTRENVKNMLVYKDDCIARPDESTDSLQPFEVISADENVFVIGPISKHSDGTFTTDYEKLEAFSNDRTINTLEQLGFVLCDGE